jgi:hypothetical protein
MTRKLAVNVVSFANATTLVRGLVGGWNLSKISTSLKNTGIGLMLLPVRGLSKGWGDSQIEVPCYENAWNNSEFVPAIFKAFGDLKFAITGSPTTQKGASVIDRVSGMNFGAHSGTLIDWLLFGTFNESFKEFRFIRNKFRNALETVHFECDGGAVIELHPEFRQEICSNYGLSQEEFLNWLVIQDFPVCLDTFHTLQRGSRDGVDLDPILNTSNQMWFIEQMGSRIKEVHFRLSKTEVKKILDGKARELEIFPVMRELYQRLENSVFVLEIYPDLFSSTFGTAIKVIRIWLELLKSFEQ